MAPQGKASLNGAFNAEDVWGGKLWAAVDYTGVASYVAGTGELLDCHIFGCPEKILWAEGAGSISGNYFVNCFPSGKGYTNWYARWYVATTGAEVSNGTNLSAETVKLFGVGI